ncbi:unnamed protein product, partial [Effrenium voratum]
MRPKHRPAWFTDAVLHKLRGKEKAARGAWKKQLQEDPAMRGVLLWQLSTLAQTVEEILTELDFVQDGPFAANPGSSLRWLDVNMYHVCQHFILPMTKEQECSYVELVASDLQPPEWMVSHAWSTQFAATASMLAKHSSSRNQEEDSAHSWKQTSYWCCTLANNQHDLSPLREADLLKTPFARVLLSNACAGTVLLCDTAVTPLRRVWCVFEAHLTQLLRSGHAKLSNKCSHFMDLVAFHEGQSVSESVAILQDGLVGWHEISAGLARFPLEVARVGTTVDVRMAQATLQCDRRAIMNHIAFGKASQDIPAIDHSSYDELNVFVHSAFASAELYRLACERPAGCVERARELLAMGADPNSFVREGNTAILALVGADPTQPTPADLPLLQEMVSLLVASGARLNHVNSHMQTALDHIIATDEASPAAVFLRSQGAVSFEESASAAEELWNSRIKAVLRRGGFGAPTDEDRSHSKPTQAFGGAGGGGSGAKLLGRAEQSLREVASLTKIYPASVCSIETPSGPHDKLGLRGKAVLAALKAAGAPNPFELRCSGPYHPRGSLPLLRVQISLVDKSNPSEAQATNRGLQDVTSIATLPERALSLRRTSA